MVPMTSLAQRISTNPPVESEPYLVALVANSWSATERAKACFGCKNSTSGPVAQMLALAPTDAAQGLH